MIYAISAAAAGVFLTLQNSVNGFTTQYVGAMGTALLVNVGVLLLLLLYRIIRERRPFRSTKMPAWYYISGILSALVVGTTGVCVASMGSAVTSCCSVAGQIMMSALVDHFALFGVEKRRFVLKRLPGFFLILGGVVAINLIGGELGNTSIGALALGIALGAASIVARMINSKVAVATGSAIDSGIVYASVAIVTSAVLFVVMSGFHPDFTAFVRIPVWYWSASLFGVSCFLCNIIAYKGSNTFFATICVMFGQVGAGIIIDALVFHVLSFGKCIGIAIVFAGVLLDKAITRRIST